MAARHDVDLPFLDGHPPISKLHREAALVDQEEFILLLVAMPDERALELDELHVMSVHFPDDFRVPMRREEGELLSQVDLLHSSSAHGYTGYRPASARSKSAHMSSADSMPTDTRISRSLIPRRARSSGVSPA